jgi:hypothetical protein
VKKRPKTPIQKQSGGRPKDGDMDDHEYLELSGSTDLAAIAKRMTLFDVVKLFPLSSFD